jgi:hypothetical protein
MEYFIAAIAALIGFYVLFRASRGLDEDSLAQKELDEYLSETLSPVDIGRLYERYIGHLFELDGYDVEYHGAAKGAADMGRDLIVSSQNAVYVVQTKCWARYKCIHENLIFQLYGSLKHFKLTTKKKRPVVKAIFFTTANFSETAKSVANVLGVELRQEELRRSYPMIKCSTSQDGEKTYHLPFDTYYDQIKVDPQNGDFFAHTVHEATAKGYRRFEKYRSSA